MRKLFAIALVALLLGVGIVAVIETDPGYVLVSYANYTLEASLWVGLLLLLLLVLSLYLLLQLAYWVVRGRRSLASWLGTRKARNALRLSTSRRDQLYRGQLADGTTPVIARGAEQRDASHQLSTGRPRQRATA